MKKLMTMLATVGMAFGLFAAEPNPIIDSFNAADGSLTDGQWSYTNAVITAGTLPPETEVSLTGDPQKLVLKTGTKTLSRNFKVNEGTFVPVEFTEAVYLDTYINFQEPCSEVQTVPADAKIAAYVLDNSELLEEQGATAVGPSTNLYAIASYWDATKEEWIPAAFMFDTDVAALADKTERRLTAKIYENVLANGNRMGFRFFLDGSATGSTDALAVKYVFPIVEGAIDFDNPIVAANPANKYLGCEFTDLNAEVRSRASADHQLVLGLVAEKGKISALDFVGKGAIGSLLLTTAKPSFIEDDANTMEVKTEGVASVTVTGAEYQDGVITFAAGTTSIGVTATYNEGCTIVKWTYQGGDVTPDPVTAEQTLTPVKGATLNIRAVAPAATVTVGGVTTEYEKLSDALSDVKTSGGTLKLMADAEINTSAGTFNRNKEIVLDLAGNDIASSQIQNPTIIVEAGQLTIIDTVGGGTIADSGAGAIENDAKLIVAGGIINGAVATVGLEDDDVATIISNGTFNAAVTLDNTEATTPATITTVGGNFDKDVFNAKTDVPGVPATGYNVVDGLVDGYWTVVKVTAYTITVDPADHGQVTTVPADTATAGETVTVTATPDQDYKLGTITVMQGANPVVVTDGKFTMPAGNVTVSATFVAKEYVAQINDDPNKKFETLAEAVAALEGGETINLLGAYQLPDAGVNFNKACTFDLGGYTLTVDGSDANSNFWVTAAVTFKNGTITETNTGNRPLYVQDGAELSLTNVSITAEGNLSPAIDVIDGTINVYADTTITSQGDVFRIKEAGAYETTINVYGGELKTTGSKGIFYHYKLEGRKLIVNIYDGEFTASTSCGVFEINSGADTTCTLGADCKAKFSTDKGLAAYCANGYKAKKNGDWYEIVAIEYAKLTIAEVEHLTISVTNAEGVAQSSGATFDKDLAIQLYVTRTPDPDYVLDGYDATSTITMSADVTVTGAVKSAVSPQPFDPTKPIPVTDPIPAINDPNDTSVKAKYLKAPDGAKTTDAYLKCFDAVDSGAGDNTVKFVLNATGSNTVAQAEAAANTDALDAVLEAPGASATLSIETPVAGFYYSLKQSDAVTTLDFNNVETDANKLATGADDETISFTLIKPANAGFYQAIVTPVPVTTNRAED